MPRLLGFTLNAFPSAKRATEREKYIGYIGQIDLFKMQTKSTSKTFCSAWISQEKASIKIGFDVVSCSYLGRVSQKRPFW